MAKTWHYFTQSESALNQLHSGALPNQFYGIFFCFFFHFIPKGNHVAKTCNTILHRLRVHLTNSILVHSRTKFTDYFFVFFSFYTEGKPRHVGKTCSTILHWLRVHLTNSILVHSRTKFTDYFFSAHVRV